MHGFSLHLESTPSMGGSLSQPVIGYKMDFKPMLCYVVWGGVNPFSSRLPTATAPPSLARQ